MAAYFVLLLAVLSRILPHSFHATGMNFTAVGGSLLFFGSRRSRWQSLVAMAALMMTDYYLTMYAYGMSFRPSGYLVTWAWYAGVCLLGHELLQGKTSALRVTGAVLGSATSFFVLSNFAVWVGSAMYPHSAAGLMACYAAAIPFFQNDLVSTGLTAGALFGVPALARQIARSLDSAQEKNLPAA